MSPFCADKSCNEMSLENKYLMRIAIPTNNPGGLEASRSDHFGHCEVFTIVSLAADKSIEKVSRSMIPFMFSMIFIVLLVIFIPAITTYLPSVLG